MALLVNAARVMVIEADELDDSPANRRIAITRWGQPRGEIAQPHLVERTTTAGGTTVDTTGRRSCRQAMRPSTATRLQELMVRGVEDGTGTNAAVPGARVGGKTGTAQHGLGNTGTPYAWFIAWAQAADSAQPAVAVAVVVEDAAANRSEAEGRARP